MDNTIVNIIKQRFIDELHIFTAFRDLPTETSQLIIGAIDQTEIADLIPGKKEVPNLSLDMDNKILFAQEADVQSDGAIGQAPPKAMSEECFIRVMKVYQDRDNAMKEEIATLQRQHNCERQPGEQCKLGTGDGRCSICKLVDGEEQIAALKMLLDSKIEQLSLQKGSIVFVHVPHGLSMVQISKIHRIFSNMTKYTETKNPVIIIPDGIKVKQFNNEQLRKVGLQHIPEIQYGLKEQTARYLRKKYEADPMYPTIDFDEWLVDYIHNIGK
jgi:hypothetical protein